MAYVWRLIVCFFVCVGPVFASLPVGPSVTTYSASPNGPWVSTPDAAALQFPVSLKVKYCAADSSFHSHDYYNGENDPPCAGPSYGPVSTRVAAGSCPIASSLQGSVCVCTSPNVEKAGSCQLAGLDVLSALNISGDSVALPSGASATLDGCYAGLKVHGGFGSQGADGRFYINGPFTSDGSPCGEGTVSAPLVVDSGCKTGEAAGMVNGLSVCAPAVERNTVQPVVTTGTGPGTLGSEAPPAAVSAEKNTSCTTSNCTTTTTYKDAGGIVIGVGTKGSTVAGFCAEVPNSPLCGQSSFSGVCGSPPACKGDAVQCAIAASNFKMSCALDATPDVVAKYAAAAAKTGDLTAALPGNQTFNIGPGSFDQTESLGAAGGLDDISVTVFGRTTVLPMSSANVWFGRLGLIAVSCTFLLCARIVVRG